MSISPTSSTSYYTTSYTDTQNMNSQFDTNIEMNAVNSYATTASEAEDQTKKNDQNTYPVVDNGS